MASKHDVISTILAEAGNSPAGMAAVAHVIANRSSQWNLSPETVVSRHHQFEGFEHPSPGGLANMNNASLRAQAEAIWEAVNSGQSQDPTNGGVNYYGSYIAPPSWAQHDVAAGNVAHIGGNVFLLGSGAAAPATGSAYANPAPTPGSLSPALAAIQGITAPGGDTDWGAFYNGMMSPSRPVPLAPDMRQAGQMLGGEFASLQPSRQVASVDPLSDLGSLLAFQHPISEDATPTLDANVNAARFPHPDAGYDMSTLSPDSAALSRLSINASGSPDDRDGGSLLSRFLSTVGGPPTSRPVQTVAINAATGMPVSAPSLSPGYNQVSEAQRNALLAIGNGSHASGASLPESAGPIYTGQGIAGTAQLPAGWHPAPGTVPSLASVPTPNSGSQYDSATWHSLIEGFNSGSASMAMNDPGYANHVTPNTGVVNRTETVNTKQLNPAFTAWMNNQKSAIYGVEGVDTPSLDAKGNVVLPASYGGAAPAAPPKYLTVPVKRTVAAPAPARAPLSGIAAAAPPPPARVASTNGYIYESNGSGGYNQVGKVNPNLTPSQQYTAAAQAAGGVAKGYAPAGSNNSHGYSGMGSGM